MAHRQQHIDLETIFKKKEIAKKRARLRNAKKYVKADIAGPGDLDLVARNFSDKQKLAIKLMTYFHETLSFRQIAKEVGISRSQLNEWRAEPAFRRKLDQAISDNQSILRLEAHRTLFKAIKGGDLKATLKYLEMTGDIRDEMTVNINDLSKLDSAQLDDEIGEMEKALGYEQPSDTAN